MNLDDFYDPTGTALTVTVLEPGWRVRVYLGEKFVEYVKVDEKIALDAINGFDPQYGAPRGAHSKAFKAIMGYDPPPPPVRPRHVSSINPNKKPRKRSR